MEAMRKDLLSSEVIVDPKNNSDAMHLIKEVMEIEYNIVIKKDVTVTRFNEKWDPVRVCLC